MTGGKFRVSLRKPSLTDLLVFDEGEIVAKAGSGSIVRRGNV